MAKGEKFIGLSNYLRDSEKNEVVLTLNQIEKIIGDKLCKSAYNHTAYWYLSDTHTFPITWIQEEYRLKSLDLNKKIAIFIKNTVDTEKKHIETTEIKGKLNNETIEVEKDIRETIIKYHYEIIKDEKGRYKSWEYCHQYFMKNKHISNEETIDITDTLITKILMGTFGCVPAYDRFFIDGIKKKKVATGNFKANSIISLVKFYLSNKEELEKCSIEINKNGVKYPQMKLIDMYFWQIGYDRSDEGKKKKIVG